MRIIDLHCDTLTLCLDGGKSLAENDAQVDLRRLRSLGEAAQCFAVFLERGRGREYYLSARDFFRRELEGSALASPALCAKDIPRAWAEGRTAALLTIEDLDFLAGSLDLLDELYSDGVRMASLTWNHPNCLGRPNSADADVMSSGLTPFGAECVARMQALGMAVDAAHLSDGGFWELCELCERPFAVSHGGAREICDVPRNLSDAQLRALAARGGVVGLYFVPRFLREGGGGGLEAAVAHARHIVNVAGIAALALGSDFDGIGEPCVPDGCSAWPEFMRALEDCFSPAELDAITWKNALRFLRDAIG